MPTAAAAPASPLWPSDSANAAHAAGAAGATGATSATSATSAAGAAMAFDAPETAPAWRATVSCNLGRLPAAHEAPPELGVGLANVRRRLALAFGDAATLRLEPLTEAAQGAQGAGSGGGVLVTVQLPCVY